MTYIWEIVWAMDSMSFFGVEVNATITHAHMVERRPRVNEASYLIMSKLSQPNRKGS